MAPRSHRNSGQGIVRGLLRALRREGYASEQRQVEGGGSCCWVGVLA